jgi:hypothetical protein
MRLQFGGSIGLCVRPGLVELCDTVPAAPEVLIFALEERSDEIVLGAEVAIEAGLGDAGFFDHEVHADGPHASFIEKRRRCAENPVSYFD